MRIDKAMFRGKSIALNTNIIKNNNYKQIIIHLRKLVKSKRRKQICKAEVIDKNKIRN